MGFSRQEYWRVQPCPPLGDLRNPGIEPRSPTLLVNSLIRAIREAREYWSGQPIPSPGDLPQPGIEPGFPALQVDSVPAKLLEEAPKGLFETRGSTFVATSRCEVQSFFYSPFFFWLVEETRQQKKGPKVLESSGSDVGLHEEEESEGGKGLTRMTESSGEGVSIYGARRV